MTPLKTLSLSLSLFPTFFPSRRITNESNSGIQCELHCVSAIQHNNCVPTTTAGTPCQAPTPARSGQGDGAGISFPLLLSMTLRLVSLSGIVECCNPFVCEIAGEPGIVGVMFAIMLRLQAISVHASGRCNMVSGLRRSEKRIPDPSQAL